MTTDADRSYARAQAERRQEFHTMRGDPDLMIADDLDGAEVHYRGLLGERQFRAEFGCRIDTSLRPGGDDGGDFYLWLLTDPLDDASAARFRIDVKVFAYDGHDARLKVPCSKIEKRTIYVAAHYSQASDAVTLRKWAWGVELIRANDIRSYSKRGTKNFTLAYEDCRDIGELKERALVRLRVIGK